MVSPGEIACGRGHIALGISATGRLTLPAPPM